MAAVTNTGHEPKAVKIEGDKEDHDTSWLDKEFSEDDCNDRPRRGAKSKNKTSNSNKDVGSGEESNSKGSTGRANRKGKKGAKTLKPSVWEELCPTKEKKKEKWSSSFEILLQ